MALGDTCLYMFLEYLISKKIEPSYSPLQVIDVDQLGILHQLTELNFSLGSHIKTDCSNYVVNIAFHFAQGNMQI